MFVGASRQRLSIENMPRHHEVREFAQQICDHCDYKIIDEQPSSRVVLLMKKDFDGRIMKF
jgi:tRNA wybutosine-synthesizing protein 1